MSITGPVEMAQICWGEDLPPWIMDLAIECARTSQNKVAAKMEYSSALISQLLRAKYPGNLDAIKEVFEGVFQSATVECPALGTLPAQKCRTWRDRSRSFASTNLQRVDMYRACNKCPRNKQGGLE